MAIFASECGPKLEMMNSPEVSVFDYKPLLLAIAVEFLGNFKDAEDAVQDTYLRWFERDTSQVVKIKPYLIATLKTVCFDWSKQTQRFWDFQKEILEMAPAKESILPAQWLEFDMDKELSRAYEAMTRKLNISEKSVFLLREVFNFDYQDIAEIVGKKTENCRKILDRAKKRLQENTERFKVEAEKSRQSFLAFQEACRNGKMSELVQSLAYEMEDKKN